MVLVGHNRIGLVWLGLQDIEDEVEKQDLAFSKDLQDNSEPVVMSPSCVLDYLVNGVYDVGVVCEGHCSGEGGA